MCLTAALNLNAELCRQYMQKARRNVESTGSTRYQNTLWNKIGSDRTSYHIDGLIDLVVAEKAHSYLNSLTRTPKSIPYEITLAKFTLS